MASEPRRVTVQSIRERFEVQAANRCHRLPTPTPCDNNAPVAAEPSLEADNNNGSSCPSETSSTDNSPTGFQNGCMQNRISIKRSPAFRTGTKATTTEALNGNKKPSLKRKPGVDRTSKPSNIHFNPPSPSSPEALVATYDETDRAAVTGEQPQCVELRLDPLLEEALKAPLPTGPAPKKPPRTFLHDVYMESKKSTTTPAPTPAPTASPAPRPQSPGDKSSDCGASPQRPVRRKNSKNQQRPASMPPFAISRSKTEPSLVRRRKPEENRRLSPPPATGHRSLGEKSPPWDDDDLSSLQCRWLNPVQWNSFSPPRKAISARDNAMRTQSSECVSASGGGRRKSTPPNRMSTSLLTIIDERTGHPPGRAAGVANSPRRPSHPCTSPRDAQTAMVKRSSPVKNGGEGVRSSGSLSTTSLPSVKGRNQFERPANREFHFASQSKLPSTARLAKNQLVSRDHHVYDQPTVDAVDLHYMCSPIVEVADINNWNNANRADESDYESDNDLNRSQLVEDRKIYVRRVSSKVCDFRKVHQRPLSTAPIIDPNGLFDSLLVVALYYDRHQQRYIPYIKSHYPNHANVPNGVEHFCFPDSTHWPPPLQTASDPYTIVLTDSKGDRQYGYCRRIVPEGAQTCIPITYCILTRHRSAGFYHKVLSVLVARHGAAESQRLALLDYLYKQSFPAPGRFIDFPPMDNGRTSACKVQRLLDARLEDMDLRVLFDHVDETVVLNILGTVLLERKLLFISRSIGILSLCIEAVQSMLYPFVWQHTLVPILPKAMSEIAAAPTPYVMGILSKNVDDWQTVTPDEGMLVDLDSGKILHCVGDESSILPRRSIRILKSAWQITANITQQADSARNALYSESFLRMFVDLCGHFEQHIQPDESGQKYFERTAFLRNHASQDVRMFLEWFTETAMFNLFIESKLRHDSPQTLFEHKIMEHSIQLVRNSQLILRNSKVLGKKIKTIGDKLREMNVFS